MLYALVVTLAIPTYPAEMLPKLDSVRFAERQRADAVIRSRMCWLNVVRLERDMAGLGAEGSTRAARIVADWWRDQYPPSSQLPFIDSLNFVNNCLPPNNRLVAHYLQRGSSYWVCRTASHGTYRAGTAALVDDLRAWRVPPSVGRLLLAVMQARSDEWEFPNRRRLR